MKRVLQIFARLDRGGLETFVMNLYRSIDRNNVQFDFLLCIPGGSYEKEARELGANIYYLPQRNAGIWQYHKALNQFFKDHARDYIAIHQHASSLSSIEPQYYAWKYNIPKRILHAHSSSIASSVKANSLHKLVHNISKLSLPILTTHFLGCSDKAIDWLFKGAVRKSQIRIINNGINISQFIFNKNIRQKVRNEFGLVDELVIGHVGSFIKVKNHVFIIKVFTELLKSIPTAKLLLVGDGTLKSQIYEQIKKARIQNSVILTGIRVDVNNLLQAMDVILMPSLFEGLPVSLVEAQASGLPLVLSDTISRDIKLSDYVQFLSIEDSLQNWVKAIMNFSQVPRNEKGDKLIKLSGYDIDRIAEMMIDLYIGTTNA